MTQDAAPPNPPRELSGRAKRRAWTQPLVRFWWLAAVVLLIIGVGFIINGLLSRQRQERLIRTGTNIDALVLQVNDERVKNKTQSAESVVILQFSWKGETRETRGRPLEGRTTPVTVGSTIRIHVDPANPDIWTPLDTPLPMLQLVLGGSIVLPVAALAFLLSMLIRASVINVYRNGHAVQTLVIDTHNAALAPFCRSVRCTPAVEGDNRVFTVCVPPRVGRPMPGDALWVIASPGKAAGAQAVEWFE